MADRVVDSPVDPVFAVPSMPSSGGGRLDAALGQPGDELDRHKRTGCGPHL
jgi:hypothetical protein